MQHSLCHFAEAADVVDILNNRSTSVFRCRRWRWRGSRPRAHFDTDAITDSRMRLRYFHSFAEMFASMKRTAIKRASLFALSVPSFSRPTR
jgi:hypothetical protein